MNVARIFAGTMDAPILYQKTRIAPTPSGFLHLGNLMSFFITADLAKNAGAKILLRIDDLDRERMERQYVEDIFDTLEFMKIDWDEGPRNIEEFESRYSQLHRMGIYNEALKQLREGGYVFACTCSRADVMRNSHDGSYPGTCRSKGIPLDAENVSWRLYTGEKDLWVNRWKEPAIKATLPASMRDFVVRKKDGFPAYQLTSLVDDVHFDTDLIVRGEDLWPSTLAQLYLASVLSKHEFLESTFYHHPLLETSAGVKLSKSAGDTSIQYLRKQGLQRTDIYAMIPLKW